MPLPARVHERPVLVPLAGKDRAGVTAAHRDHDVGGSHVLGEELGGDLSGDVDPNLGHRLDRSGVDRLGGCGTCRTYDHAVAAMVAQEPCSHLGTTGIVDTDEQNFGHGGHEDVFLLAGELDECRVGDFGGQGGEVVLDACLGSDAFVRVGDVGMDGLGAEDARELRRQVVGDALQQLGRVQQVPTGAVGRAWTRRARRCALGGHQVSCSGTEVK